MPLIGDSENIIRSCHTHHHDFLTRYNVSGDYVTDTDQLILSGTAGADSTVDVGATLVGATINGGGASFATGTMPNGVQSVTAIDTVAGGISAAPAALAVTSDTVLPTTPTLTSWSPDSVADVDNGVTNSDVLTLTGSADANDTVTVFDNGVKIGAAIANSSGVWNFTTPVMPNGTNAFTELATDAAGTTSPPQGFPTNVIVDTSPPYSAPTLVGGAQIGVMVEGAESSWIGFPVSSDLDYLKSHGVDLIRLPIAWELMQPTLNGPLNQSYLAGLETVLQEAATRGMQVVVELDNFGGYDPNWQQVAASNNGNFSSAVDLGQPIGSAAVPVSSFVNFWTQLGTALSGNAGLAGYDLMNEPQGGIPNSTWQTAAQEAINAIRGVDMLSTIYVEGNNWSQANEWNLPWYNETFQVTDPANKLIYEAHEYFSSYTQPFNSQTDYTNLGIDLLQPFMSWLKANNDHGIIGEFGIPTDGSSWQPMLEAFMNYLQANDIPGIYCNYTYNQTSPLGIDPQVGQGASTMELIFEHTAPTIAGYVSANGVNIRDTTTANVLTLTGTGASYNTVNVYDNGTLIGTTTSNVSGAWSFTTGALANGIQNFAATNIDAAGNSSETSYTLAVTVNAPMPTVSSVVPSGSGIINGDGDLKAGHLVTLTLNMSEVVTVANGTPTLTLNDGGTATYASGSGSNALTFTYTVAAGQNTPNLTISTVNLNGATIADAAGNNATLSGTFNPVGTLQIDTTAPVVTSVTTSGAGVSAGNGDLNAGHLVTLTLNMNEAVTVANGTPTLTLNDNGTATYTGGSGSNALTFAYTVAAGQNTPDVTISTVDLNGATIADAAGNNATLSGTFNPVGTLQIDTTTPTVASVTTSGAAISGGSGDLSAGHLVTLTLHMSEAVTVASGTPTLTLNDGGTATYAGGSGSSALIFIYTVAAGQNTTDLMVSALNLNGGTIADAAGNNASLSGTFNPAGMLQIDTAPPSPPVISTDGINSNNSITLNGTAEANSTLTIYDGHILLGTTTVNPSGVWTYTTGPLDSGAQVFTATAMDVAGNISALSNSVDPIIGSATTTEIAAIYNAVLQRSPTDTEVTASLAIDSTLGSSGMIAAIVDSAEAITNVYPVLQMFDLAFGRFPSAATLASMVDTKLSVSQLAAAVVASETFANTYNSGTLIDPNSPLTAGIVEALYDQALGHQPVQATLNGWLNSGLTVAQAFLDMVTSQSYFEATETTIEQYLTAAAINNEAYAVASATADLNPNQVSLICEAVLQSSPTAAQVTASLALDSATGNVGMIAALVDSAAAINNVYPVMQMFELAFGHFPSAATLASMVGTGLTVAQLSGAIVSSQTFADVYNDGTLLNSNSPVTANIVEALYSQALGHPPTQTTLDSWLNSGLTVAQAFDDMVTSQSYFDATQTSIEQYLVAAAINEAGLTSIIGTETAGVLTLGTAMMPLTEAGLTVSGGSGVLTVVAGGPGDTITQLNTSTAGGSITANGAGDTINAANGPNMITADGAGDNINLGAVSTGTSITSAQTIHATGAGDVITFVTTAADGTAVTWAGVSTVDGGDSFTGIGASSTVNFGNNTGSGSETVVITGDLSGATTFGGTSTAGIAMITLGNVVDGAGDQIIFNNAKNEVLVGNDAVNVAAAGSMAQAFDMAASAAGDSQSGGMIPANTGLIDWFQYGGNTYVIEAINAAGTAGIHGALATSDEVIKIVGLVNLAGEILVGHALTL